MTQINQRTQNNSAKTHLHAMMAQISMKEGI